MVDLMVFVVLVAFCVVGAESVRRICRSRLTAPVRMVERQPVAGGVRAVD